jgi:L-aspartate oxidase
MSRDASVVRDADGLRALGELLAQAPDRPTVRRAELEDAALTATASVVAAAALERTESRGCHHRSDHPGPDPARAISTSVRIGPAGRPVVEQPAVACC